MKKTVAFLFSLLMMISLAACGNSSNQTEQPSAERNSVESSGVDDVEDAVTDETQEETETQEESDIQEETKTQEESKAQEESDIPKEQGTRILVAYFSATNTTEGVAEHIANGLDAELYEIVPEEPYTDADLDYNDDSSRSTIEMNDPDARPAISGSVENMDQYDIVFLGFPNWWASIPMPIASFLEEYDFSGKTLIPFCSHGGGRFGQSLTAIAKLVPDARMGEALSVHYSGGSDLPDEITEWLKTNGIIK